MAGHQTPGAKTALRLAARGDSLQKKELSDGGEVYTGSLAKRALSAMGARAMTLDETIIVDDTFDESKPEDQALYAHERLHQMESGGHGAEGSRDAEEVAARAVERMVLHRASHGEGLSSIMRDVTAHGAALASATGPLLRSSDENATVGQPGAHAAPTKPEDELAAAYGQMLETAHTHEGVVKELARFVLDQLDGSAAENRFRLHSSRTV